MAAMGKKTYRRAISPNKKNKDRLNKFVPEQLMFLETFSEPLGDSASLLKYTPPNLLTQVK